MANEYKGKLKVVSADVAVAGETAAGLGIMGIPTLVFYKGGQEVHRIVGARPKPAILDAIKKSLGI